MRARHWLGSIVVAMLANASGCTSPAEPAGPVVPAGPSNLAAVAVDRSTVRLTWSDNSTDEAGFTVERASAASGPWQAAATTGAGITTVDVASLAAGTTHHFRMRAFNDAGASEWTPVASATTPPPEPVVRGLLFAPPVVHRNSAGLLASMPSGSGERYTWSVIPGTASGELVGGASGNVVQFRTGAQPGILTLVANVTDGAGRVASSQASVQVVGGWLFDPEPLPRSSHAAVLLPGGRVLVLGGIVGSGSTLPVDVTQVYDPETGGWAPGARVPLARSFFPAVTLSDGRVLVAGGGDQGATFTNVDIYDPDTGSWQPTGALGIARESHTATLLADGRVLVVGGTAKVSSVAAVSAELYDPATGTWTPAAPLPWDIGGTAVLLRDGRVLLTGRGASTLLYNPAAGTWSPAAPMARAREAHTATVLSDGKVLVVGGFGNAQPDTPYTAEVYDPATDTWTSVGPLTASRIHHAAARMADGRVLISGGFSDSGGAALASVEFYDPVSGSITAGPDMSGPRVFHTATPLPGGGVLVIGGRDTGPNLATAERFDPATGAWRSAGAGTTLNPGAHTAELLQDGSLLQIGGRIGLMDASAACNRFDPVARAWTPVANMVTARYLHASVRLADGRVVAMGGLPSGAGPPRPSGPRSSMIRRPASGRRVLTWSPRATITLRSASRTAPCSWSEARTARSSRWPSATSRTATRGKRQGRLSREGRTSPRRCWRRGRSWRWVVPRAAPLSATLPQPAPGGWPRARSMQGPTTRRRGSAMDASSWREGGFRAARCRPWRCTIRQPIPGGAPPRWPQAGTGTPPPCFPTGGCS